MAVQHDKLIVVDIEATCWEDNIKPPGQQSEIIEVGLCLLEVDSCTLAGKRSILVRPERSKISDFCTQLTSLTADMLFDEGVWFFEACDILLDEFNTRDYAWASWGNYDRLMFTRQCEDRRLEYPFSRQHNNIKTLYARLYNLERPVGLTKALELSGLGFEGTQHRGHDDAWNIGRLTVHLLDEFGPEILNGRR